MLLADALVIVHGGLAHGLASTPVNHSVKMGAKADASKLPRIYFVNWFRKSPDGKWLWPGFGENSRVLKWIFDRCAGTAHATDTVLGPMPTDKDLDLSGLDIPVYVYADYRPGKVAHEPLAAVPVPPA